VRAQKERRDSKRFEICLAFLGNFTGLVVGAKVVNESDVVGRERPDDTCGFEEMAEQGMSTLERK